jgi:hypothetical protein
MLASRARTLLVTAICIFTLTGGLAACSSTDTPAKSGSSGSGNSDSGTASKSGDTAPDVVLAGTGRYSIGTEAPLGGYQLTGEPDKQPNGCTWSIQDADGAAIFENQGSYAFLTDIREAVTFVTDGCPDWRKFE